MTIERDVTDTYLETALWTCWIRLPREKNDTGKHFNADYCVEDFTKESDDAALADCTKFIELLRDAVLPDDVDFDNLYDAAESLQGNERIGHNFWLTRSGHGAGFWDGDYADYGDRICEVLYAGFGRYSEFNLYVSGDGQVDFA